MRGNQDTKFTKRDLVDAPRYVHSLCSKVRQNKTIATMYMPFVWFCTDTYSPSMREKRGTWYLGQCIVWPPENKRSEQQTTITSIPDTIFECFEALFAEWQHAVHSGANIRALVVLVRRSLPLYF
ncbi:unnamed protein product [Ixodes persulcatus]